PTLRPPDPAAAVSRQPLHPRRPPPPPLITARSRAVTANPKACGAHAASSTPASVTLLITARSLAGAASPQGMSIPRQARWCPRGRVPADARRPLRDPAVSVEIPHNVETLHLAEIKHLSRVRNFHVMQSFHDKAKPKGFSRSREGTVMPWGSACLKVHVGRLAGRLLPWKFRATWKLCIGW